MTSFTLPGYEFKRSDSETINAKWEIGRTVAWRQTELTIVSENDEIPEIWRDEPIPNFSRVNTSGIAEMRLGASDFWAGTVFPADDLHMSLDRIVFSPGAPVGSLTILRLQQDRQTDWWIPLDGTTLYGPGTTLADVQATEALIDWIENPGAPFTVDNRVPLTAVPLVGISEQDRYFGTIFADTADLGAGDDLVRGGGGNDNLGGGIGNDVLLGDDGSDFLRGDAGNDTVRGGVGDDWLEGGDGSDRLDGEAGADWAYGGAGADTVEGGIGDDMLDGGEGADSLLGDDGADSLSGGYGDDDMKGGVGRDTLDGGEDDDRIDGGDNADLLNGAEGADTMLGGRGCDAIRGSDGSDLLFGQDGNDTLEGGEGGDTLTGGSGTIEALRAVFAFDDFDTDHGWTSQNRTPRLMGDIDGDGAADIVGFGWLRAFSAFNDGAGGFDGPGGAIDNFAISQGWQTMDGQLRLLGDADGDGDDDIIGFGINSGFVAFSNGDGTFSGFKRAVENFANAQGWRSDNDTPRVMADVNGDGIDDIIGFGNKVTFTALGNGDGTFGNFRAAIENFSKAQGWATNDAFLRLSGDVNGDGLDDIVGFGVKATFTALSNGDGTFGSFRRGIDNFAQDQGWSSNDATPRLLADVNGDGLADIVGFGGSAVFAGFGVGDGTFGRFEAISDDFNRAMGWTSNDALLRSVADIDGDGDDDLIGFSGDVRHQRVGPEFDTFVFESGYGLSGDGVTDRIVDFDPRDKLDMRLTDLSPVEALTAASQVGDDVEILYNEGSPGTTEDDCRVILQDFDLASLTLDNFL